MPLEMGQYPSPIREGVEHNGLRILVREFGGKLDRRVEIVECLVVLLRHEERFRAMIKDIHRRRGIHGAAKGIQSQCLVEISQSSLLLPHD